MANVQLVGEDQESLCLRQRHCRAVIDARRESRTGNSTVGTSASAMKASAHQKVWRTPARVRRRPK
jgi:hypothetical protein